MSEKPNLRSNGDLFTLTTKYDLGEMALEDSFDKASRLWRKVKVIVTKTAVDSDGKISMRWRKLSLQSRSAMVEALYAVAPWLRYFENDWGAEWLLSKAINQRVTDANRGNAKKKEKDALERLALAKGEMQNTCSSSSKCSSLYHSTRLRVDYIYIISAIS